MKRLITIAVAVVMVIAALAVVGPVSAGPPANPAVFESNIVPTSWGTHPLDEGEVKVWADGSVEIKIKGAMADTTYRVFFGQQPAATEQITAWILDWTPIGTFTTDENGDQVFTADPATITGPLMAPAFAINYPELTFTQFATGF